MTRGDSATAVSDFPRIVSVDDHLVEPPSLWRDRLPSKYVDVGPRVSRERVPRRVSYSLTDVPDTTSADDVLAWCDVWCYEDVRLSLDRAVASAGMPPEDVDLIATTYDEIRPGCFQQAARLEDMTLNHVERSICYPNTFVRFAGQRFLEANDKELALLCVQAYNDFLTDEWAYGSEGRLIPAYVLPLWDIELAVAELERVAACGARVLSFPELPTFLGLPSLHSGHWDPLLASCASAGLVLSMHIGSASYQLTTSPDAPLAAIGIMGFASAMMSLVDWLVSGLLAKYPRLRLSFAECQIGWIPYVLERADKFATSNWAVTADVASRLSLLPSEYFRRQVYVCFFEDQHGLRSLSEIGAGNVCFETDYPHPDSTWPNSLPKAQELCRGIDEETTNAVIRANAIRLLSDP